MQSAKAELDELPVFDRRRIVTEMRTHLTETPAASTRNRKRLGVLAADFEYVPPLWELRSGEFRVMYDVDVEEHEVNIRAVRRKGPEQTTQEVVRG
jgi:mRNA-degrading endonuclease RelE of RelBE toxin-antitoxin system